MASTGLNRPPEGVALLPQASAKDGQLDPKAWVESVRKPTPRKLRQPLAEYLTEARDLGEV